MLDGVSVCFVDAIEARVVADRIPSGHVVPATTTASGKKGDAGRPVTAELDRLYPAEELMTLTTECCHPKRSWTGSSAGPPPRLLMELRGERSGRLVGCGVVPVTRTPRVGF